MRFDVARGPSGGRPRVAARALPLVVLGFALAASAEAQSPVDVSLSAPDGLRISVPDAAQLTIEPHVAAWLRVEGESTGSVQASVPLLRASVVSTLLGGLVRARVKGEFGDLDPRLLDAFLEIHPESGPSVRIGRFKTPFSRLYQISTTRLDLPDRGIAVDEFRAGRALGVMVVDRPTDALRLELGVFATGGKPMAMARVEVTPYGSVPRDLVPSLSRPHPSGLSIGVNGYYRGAREGVDGSRKGPDGTGGIDFQLVEGPFTFLAEGFLRETASEDGGWTLALGGVAQASVFVVPRTVELIARANWLDRSLDTAELEHTYEAAVTTYVPVSREHPGHNVQLCLRYQLVAPEMTHRITAQLQLAL